MAQKVSAKALTKTGREITLYGRVTEDGTQVAVWSKDANYGIYNLSRFEGSVLSAASFRKFFGLTA